MKGVRSFLIIILLSFLLSLSIDRITGAVWDPPLIFPRHIRVSYHTPEFNFEVVSNNVGLRDREMNRRKHGYRILAIGDSFTYGWGVRMEESWPKVLERNLNNVEVVN